MTVPLKTLAEVNAEYIRMVLYVTEGSISDAARTLGLHRRTLQRMLRPPRKKRKRRRALRLPAF